MRYSITPWAARRSGIATCQPPFAALQLFYAEEGVPHETDGADGGSLRIHAAPGYRPADVDLARRIHRLLNQDGYTIRGVQQLLKSGGAAQPEAAAAAVVGADNVDTDPMPNSATYNIP